MYKRQVQGVLTKDEYFDYKEKYESRIADLAVEMEQLEEMCIRDSTYTVSGDTEIKALWENSVITPTTYPVTVSNDGNGTGTATPSTAATGTEITLTAMPKEGYHFKEWQVICV